MYKLDNHPHKLPSPSDRFQKICVDNDGNGIIKIDFYKICLEILATCQRTENGLIRDHELIEAFMKMNQEQRGK